MRMTPHPEGFVVPAGAALELRAGQEIVLLLTFEKAGEMQVTVHVMDKCCELGVMS